MGRIRPVIPGMPFMLFWMILAWVMLTPLILTGRDPFLGNECRIYRPGVNSVMASLFTGKGKIKKKEKR